MNNQDKYTITKLDTDLFSYKIPLKKMIEKLKATFIELENNKDILMHVYTYKKKLIKWSG